jgi:hypothetical protein
VGSRIASGPLILLGLALFGRGAIMKFLTGVLIVTIASAVGLVLLQFFGKKGGGAKAEAKSDPAPEPKAPGAKAEAKADPAPPCVLPPLSESESSGSYGGSGSYGSYSGSGPARQIRARLQLSHVLAEEFCKLENDVLTWKPTTALDAVHGVRIRIMKVVQEWEKGTWTPPK